MRQVNAYACRPLDVKPCTEYHRLYWCNKNLLEYPPGTLEGPARGPQVKEGLGKRPKVWGALMSDNGKANDDNATGWKFGALQRSLSDPSLTKSTGKKVNPSLISRGVTTSMTSGTNICLKHTIDATMARDEKRQVGLYEESFPFWRGNYCSADFGLNTSDVTRMADAMVKQKDLMRT